MFDMRKVVGGVALAPVPKSSQPIVIWPGLVALPGLITSCGCESSSPSGFGKLPLILTVVTPLKAKGLSFGTDGLEIGVPTTTSARFGLK